MTAAKVKLVVDTLNDIAHIRIGGISSNDEQAIYRRAGKVVRELEPGSWVKVMGKGLKQPEGPIARYRFGPRD